MYALTYTQAGWKRNGVIAAAILGVVLLQPARAGVLEAANSVRREGCEQRPAVKEPLRHDPALDRVAGRWAGGGSLQSAEEKEGYRARNSVGVKLPARDSDLIAAGRLRSSHCRALTDPALREAGLAIRGDAAWLVLAEPHSTPAATDAPRVAAEVLALVNQARSVARRCGRAAFSAAPPLRDSALLSSAAQSHARDMAQNDFLGHGGSDGSQPADRAQQAGYAWRVVGENVAGGPSSAREVVEGWLASADHCRNIMEEGFSEMGVAYATAPESRLVIYWSQMFGRPR